MDRASSRITGRGRSARLAAAAAALAAGGDLHPSLPTGGGGGGRTMRAWRSARRRESEGRGLTPSPLQLARAKWVKPYLSASGLGLHCSTAAPESTAKQLCKESD